VQEQREPARETDEHGGERQGFLVHHETLLVIHESCAVTASDFVVIMKDGKVCKNLLAPRAP
jgi:hypothetical protein